jgi:hypothetical protein
MTSNYEEKVKITGWTVRSSDPVVINTFLAWSLTPERKWMEGVAPTVPGALHKWEITYERMKALRHLVLDTLRPPLLVAQHETDHDLLLYIKAEIESNVEEMEIEEVFGLTGGELESESFLYTYPADVPSTERRSGIFHFWYTGVPEYVEREIVNSHPWNARFMTILRTSPYETAEVIFTKDDEAEETETKWQRIHEYSSSGECECPFRHEEDPEHGKSDDGVPLVGPGGCHLCEADPGDAHGHIYIGDGCAEVVYRTWDANEINGVLKATDDHNLFKVDGEYVTGNTEWLKANVGKDVDLIGDEWVERQVVVNGAEKTEWVFDVKKGEVIP